mgnify:CR=1 FL=1
MGWEGFYRRREGDGEACRQALSKVSRTQLTKEMRLPLISPDTSNLQASHWFPAVTMTSPIAPLHNKAVTIANR